MTSSLPAWAENAGAVAIVLVASLTGIFNYFKTEKKEASSQAGLTSTDSSLSRILKDMLESLREFQDESNRDIKRTQRFIHELQEAINRNTRALDSVSHALKDTQYE